MVVWKKILKSVALTAVSSHPAGAGILAAVNAFLPEEKKLPVDATGNQVESAIEAMPAEQRAAALDRLADVEIVESNNFAQVQKALASADGVGSSTRPEIALMMAKTVCFAVVVLIAAIAVSLALGESQAIQDLGEAWLLIGAVLGTPTVLLRAYFGLRTKEKQSRYAAANGAVDVGISKGLLSRFGL